MAAPKRREIWVVDFGRIADAFDGELVKVRPGLIVSAAAAKGPRVGRALIVPASTADVGNDAHIPVAPGEGGLDRRSFLACDDVRSVGTAQLDFERGPLGRISEGLMRRVDERVDAVLEGR